MCEKVIKCLCILLLPNESKSNKEIQIIMNLTG
jgi:hypothetical protein